jgi:hypothetical protein
MAVRGRTGERDPSYGVRSSWGAKTDRSSTIPKLLVVFHCSRGQRSLLDQKGCKLKCRFSQVIILGKYEVDPQGMVDTK